MRNFKKALLWTLGLLLSAALIYTVLTWPYFHGDSYYYQDAAVRDGLSGQLDVLICGASHGFRGIVPEVMDESWGCCSYNLSGSMQTMRSRYYLLRQEIERNPVKTVVMELSYNAFSRSRDREGPEGDIYTLGRFSDFSTRFSFFRSAFRPSEYGRLYFDTLDRSLKLWQGQIPEADHSGKGYIPLDSVPQTPPPKEEIYHTFPTELNVSYADTWYIDRCMELCMKNDIRVIFVTTPMATENLLRHEDLEGVRQIYEAYTSGYHCDYYDFNLLKNRTELLPEDSAYYDASHLSRIGAPTFTQLFCETVTRADNGEDVSDLFYPDYNALTEALMAP